MLGKVGNVVGNPRPESCVDEKTSGLEHMMVALLGFVKKLEVKTYLQGYHNDGEAMVYDDLYAVLHTVGSFRMVDAVC